MCNLIRGTGQYPVRQLGCVVPAGVLTREEPLQTLRLLQTQGPRTLQCIHKVSAKDLLSVEYRTGC